MNKSDLSLLYLRGPVHLGRFILDRFVTAGDTVIDATCGNGHDTLHLAALVGESGRVWSFDIQPAALSATAERLAAAGLTDRVNLIECSHGTLGEVVQGRVTAAVFNLGYLPGGDRSVVTRPESTVAALCQALEILAPGGIITVSVYPGHPGGDAEAAAITSWASSCSPRSAHVWQMGQLNARAGAPYFILIQKASSCCAP